MIANCLPIRDAISFHRPGSIEFLDRNLPKTIINSPQRLIAIAGFRSRTLPKNSINSSHAWCRQILMETSLLHQQISLPLVNWFDTHQKLPGEEYFLFSMDSEIMLQQAKSTG